jgi:hypothetical protein
MRTLVNLLNNDLGYVRIYAEIEGFSYQLSTYSPPTIPDLFAQMGGYSSVDDACAAAKFQLSSIHQPAKRRRKRFARA